LYRASKSSIAAPTKSQRQIWFAWSVVRSSSVSRCLGCISLHFWLTPQKDTAGETIAGDAISDSAIDRREAYFTGRSCIAVTSIRAPRVYIAHIGEHWRFDDLEKRARLVDD
jgi:hypothetical protein